nr:MAG TPA: hypothetical protein [Caudoviricetes sp.]
MTVFLIIGFLLNRRFGSRIFIKYPYKLSTVLSAHLAFFFLYPYNFTLVTLQLFFTPFYSCTPLFSDTLRLIRSPIC